MSNGYSILDDFQNELTFLFTISMLLSSDNLLRNACSIPEMGLPSNSSSIHILFRCLLPILFAVVSKVDDAGEKSSIGNKFSMPFMESSFFSVCSLFLFL